MLEIFLVLIGGLLGGAETRIALNKLEVQVALGLTSAIYMRHTFVRFSSIQNISVEQGFRGTSCLIRRQFVCVLVRAFRYGMMHL